MLVKTGRGGRPRPPKGIPFEYNDPLAGVILRFGRAGRPRPAGRETLWVSRLRPSGPPIASRRCPYLLTIERGRDALGPPYRRLRRHYKVENIITVWLSGDNRGGFLHFAYASVEMTLKRNR